MNEDLASANIIRKKCNKLASSVQVFVQEAFPNRTTSFKKCSRDAKYVIQAIAKCLESGNSDPIYSVAAKFYKGSKLQIVSIDAEVSAYTYLKSQIETIDGLNNDAKTNCSLLIDKFIHLLSNGLDEPFSIHDSWQNTISKKTQIAVWNNDIPDEYIIQDIVNELHLHSPSKQNLVRYNLTVVKNYADVDRKLAIYGSTETWPGSSLYNGQVLAPYLFVFSERQYGEEHKAKNAIKNYHYMIDVGIAASFVAYSAVSKGLSIGFCACLTDSKRLHKIFGFYPDLIIGVGYPDPVETTRFICPILKRYVNAPSRHVPKPDISEYIRYL